MRPIFTINAGEYLFGEEVKRRFSDFELWIPVKDTGVDFLITRPGKRKPISVQVKMSKDHRKPTPKTDFDKKSLARGWFTLRRDKLRESTAHIWSLILISRERTVKPFFINIKPSILLKKLETIHDDGNSLQEKEPFNVYPWIIKQGNKTICVEGRGLNTRQQQADVAAGTFPLGSRDWTAHYDNWDDFRN